MPIYEYACENCQSEFEVEQRITEDPVKTCPSCRSRKVKRLISQTSFVLKGSGWYSDLYSSPAEKTDEKTDEKKDEKKDAKDKDTSGSSSEKSEKSDKSKGKSKGGSKGTGKGKSKGPKAAA